MDIWFVCVCVRIICSTRSRHTHLSIAIQPLCICICRTGFDSCDTISFLFNKHEQDFSICLFFFPLFACLCFHAWTRVGSNKSGRLTLTFRLYVWVCVCCGVDCVYICWWLLHLIDSVRMTLVHMFLCSLQTHIRIYFNLCRMWQTSTIFALRSMPYRREKYLPEKVRVDTPWANFCRIIWKWMAANSLNCLFQHVTVLATNDIAIFHCIICALATSLKILFSLISEHPICCKE